MGHKYTEKLIYNKQTLLCHIESINQTSYSRGERQKCHKMYIHGNKNLTTHGFVE